MATETDEKIKQLFTVLENKRKEIKKIERPKWVTNCSFSYSADRSAAFNIHVISDENVLIDMLAFLLQKEEYFLKAAEELSLTKVQFKWHGYTVKEWKDDINMRLGILNLNKKKQQLEEYEARLNKQLSPEEIRRLEVDAIAAAMLGSE